MTAKRFTIENDIEMKDNWNINKRCYHFGNGFDAKDCCNMLNELQDENKELKKENEQLKQRNEFLKKQLDRVCSENEMMGDKLKKIGRIL